MRFSEYWSIEKGEKTPESYVENAKLTKAELMKVRNLIADMQKKGVPSSKIIKTLQLMNKKLVEKYRAENVYWTESKRLDSDKIKEAGIELGVKEYNVVLSPNACEVCREKSENGKKIFKNSDFEKSGYGHVPPFHPQCYCIILPK